jgi:superfamily I DNA/RNA helicase
LGLAILREHWNAAGLQRGFRVASEAERRQRLQAALDVSERQARRLLTAIARVKRTRVTPEESNIVEALETYEQQLTLRNWVDYDDLVGRAAEALTAHPNLRALYQQRYPWVFIDEYQDVDEQQVRLLKQLVLPQGHLCAIGDPDQAIYGFRGADVGFFEHFDLDFPEPQIVQLRRNYRSDPHIVTAALQVMAVCRQQSPRLAVCQSEPRQIIVHAAPSEKAEAEFVVQTIEHILGGHSFFSLDSGRGAQHVGDHVSFADFAVLYRTEAQRPALIEALQRSGMPFQQRSHQLLMAHPGVPVLIDAMLNSPASGTLRTRLEAVVTRHDHTAEVSPALREALDLVQPIALACGEDVERFVAEVAVGAQVDTWDERADRIALLTLHAAKGLEFPVVFMVGCEAGILPLTWGRTKDADRDEERRLFYVGMTRAQRGLYLCHVRTRLWRGRVRMMAPSPFVTDIEDHLLARQHSQRPRSKGRQALPQLELF